MSEMSNSGAEIRAVPEGYHAVTPWIISRDTAGLIEFVGRAFGAEEIARVHNEDGSIGHAEFRIGDSVVMAFDATEEWPDTPGFLRLYVEDADEVHRRALEAGATSVTEVTGGDTVDLDDLPALVELLQGHQEVDELVAVLAQEELDQAPGLHRVGALPDPGLGDNLAVDFGDRVARIDPGGNILGRNGSVPPRGGIESRVRAELHQRRTRGLAPGRAARRPPRDAPLSRRP